jgi:hypothetical protein
MGTQIAAKAKALGRLYHDGLVNGDASINAGVAFDGLKALSTNADANASQTISAAGGNGGALTFSLLDNLLDLVPNGADAIVMRRGTLRAFRAALRLQGGSTGSEVIMNDFGQPQIAHNGTPIIINDFLPANEVKGTSGAVCASVYAVRLNEVDGLHGLYGGANAGIRVENVGTHQTKDADIVRLKWYAGLVLKSSKSLARLEGVTNV